MFYHFYLVVVLIIVNSYASFLQIKTMLIITYDTIFVLSSFLNEIQKMYLFPKLKHTDLILHLFTRLKLQKVKIVNLLNSLLITTIYSICIDMAAG